MSPHAMDVEWRELCAFKQTKVISNCSSRHTSSKTGHLVLPPLHHVDETVPNIVFRHYGFKIFRFSLNQYSVLYKHANEYFDININ